MTHQNEGERFTLWRVPPQNSDEIVWPSHISVNQGHVAGLIEEHLAQEPVHSTKAPPHIYHLTREQNASYVAEAGLWPGGLDGDRGDVHLASTWDMAMAIATKKKEHNAIVVVDTQMALSLIHI